MKSFYASLLLLSLLLPVTAEEQPWSEAVNGLRARFSVTRMNDSPFVKVFLEIQNTSDVMGIRTIRFTGDSITPMVTTAAGKSLLKANGDHSGFLPVWTPLKLPLDSTLRFRISFPSMAFNPNKEKTIVDLGSQYSWIIPDGDACFLSAKLKIEKEDGDKDHVDWSGTLSLPLVSIPQK